MIKVETEYNKVPDLVAKFAPELQKHEYHPPVRGSDFVDTLKSIFYDPHNQINKLGKTVIKCSIGGTIIGAYYNLFFAISRKQISNIRASSQYFLKNLMIRSRTYGIYGGFFGLCWYLIYHQIFCPHGNQNLRGFLMSYAAGGAILTATLYHPSTIFYGGIFGLFLATIAHMRLTPKTPPGFAVKLPIIDENKRQQKIINEIEKQLSSAVVLNDRRKFDEL